MVDCGIGALGDIAMSLWDIALRSAALWVVGQFGLGFLGAFAATQRLPFFRGAILLVIFKGCIILGCFGVGLLCRQAIIADNDLFDGRLVQGAVFVGSLWFSFVFLQYVQNFFYRAVDIRPQPIRWFAGHEPAKRRRRGRSG